MGADPSREKETPERPQTLRCLRFINKISVRAQSKAYVQRLIHPLLVGGGDLSGALPQAVLIQRADLFQQHHTVLGKAGQSDCRK